MADERVYGFWFCTWRLSGGSRAPCEQLHPLGFIEVTSPGKESLETVLVLLDRARAPAGGELEEGAARSGGPKRRFSSSLKRAHGGVPSSVCTCMYHICAASWRLYDAIHDALLREGLALV
jgi:hypothetical protein